MSEDSRPRVAMRVATGVMNPPPTPFSGTERFRLGRVVPLREVVAFAVGAASGLVSGVIVGAATGWWWAVTMLPALLGWAAVGLLRYEPLPGENVQQWATLHVQRAARRSTVSGDNARIYVGVAPVTRLAAGRVRVAAGSIPVPAGAVDDRGAFRGTAPSPHDPWLEAEDDPDPLRAAE